MEFIAFPIIFICLVLIIRPLTVLLHELGHAIPAIIMTKKKVIIYIGSYGDPTKGGKLSIRNLEIYFRYNPFAWRLGLCLPSAENISINRQIIYIAFGPIISFLIAILASYFIFAYDLHGFLKLYIIVFLGSSFLDLLINLIPRETPIKLYNGKITHNDGYKLKLLLAYKLSPENYKKAADLFNNKKYAESSEILDNLIIKGNKNEHVFRLAIHIYILQLKYKQAKELLDKFLLTDKMNSDDFANMGLVYSKVGMNENAILFYDKSLNINPDNFYSLNNKGFTLNLMNRFEEAVLFFDRAIQIDIRFAYSYANRGLAKIRIGQIDEGLKDINHSIELDNKNSYGYRNLGMYYLNMKDYAEALKLFKKAKDLDQTTHLIEDLLKEAGEKVVE